MAGYFVFRSFTVFSARTANAGYLSIIMLMERPTSGATRNTTDTMTPKKITSVRSRLTIRRNPMDAGFLAFFLLARSLVSIFSIQRIGTLRMNATHPPIMNGVRIVKTRPRYCLTTPKFRSPKYIRSVTTMIIRILRILFLLSSIFIKLLRQCDILQSLLTQIQTGQNSEYHKPAQ